MAFQGKIGRYLPMPLRLAARRAHHAYHLGRGRWLGSQPRMEAPGLPLAVLGLFSSVLGLGQGARLFLDACESVDIATDPIDVSGYFSLDQTLPSPVLTSTRVASAPATLVAHLNPVELQYLIGRLGSRLPLQAYRIGYWAWETTEIPAEWLEGAALVDEVWCPSQFTANAVRASLGPDKRINVLPHPVFAPACVAPDKARFGLDPTKTSLFCALDLKSSVTRKNPMGAVEAFVRSGMGQSGQAELLVKLHGSHPGGTRADDLASRLAGAPGVVILEERLQSAEMAQLLGSVDIVLSAHRSEGYGLVLAEAMAAGKTVIATGWSGNTDFMDETNSAPVRYRLTPVHDPEGIYWSGLWAEPDIDHMAELISQLVASPERRTQLGAAARAQVLRTCGIEAWHDRINGLLGA